MTVIVNDGSDWIAGAFGLAGVIVGGLVTAGGVAIRDRRAERPSAQAAARILRRQLMTVASSVATVARLGTLGPTRSLDTSAWDTYAEVFAVALKPAESSTVGSAVTQIRRTGVSTIRMQGLDSETDVVSLSPNVVAVLSPIYGDCQAAFEALHRISREPASEKRLGTVASLSEIASVESG
jgi:hypothetical protein